MLGIILSEVAGDTNSFAQDVCHRVGSCEPRFFMAWHGADSGTPEGVCPTINHITNYENYYSNSRF